MNSISTELRAHAAKCTGAAAFCDPPEVAQQLAAALNLAALLAANGGTCKWCHGTREITASDPGTERPCPRCNATGTEPAVTELFNLISL